MSRTSELTIDPIIPVGGVILIGLALALVTLVIYARLGDTLGRGQKAFLLLLRLCGVALVALLLVQPSKLETIMPPQIDRVTIVAVDHSRSMAQRDTQQGTRSEAAQAILRDSGIVKGDTLAGADLRLYRFSADATPLQRLSQLDTEGETTRIHSSVTSILGSLGAN
jgi:hypothetical protein